MTTPVVTLYLLRRAQLLREIRRQPELWAALFDVLREAWEREAPSPSEYSGPRATG